MKMTPLSYAAGQNFLVKLQVCVFKPSTKTKVQHLMLVFFIVFKGNGQFEAVQLLVAQKAGINLADHVISANLVK
jgi:hypothetical protein